MACSGKAQRDLRYDSSDKPLVVRYLHKSSVVCDCPPSLLGGEDEEDDSWGGEEGKPVRADWVRERGTKGREKGSLYVGSLGGVCSIDLGGSLSLFLSTSLYLSISLSLSLSLSLFLSLFLSQFLSLSLSLYLYLCSF